MDEFINVSHIFINDISTYIATFCDLKKITKRSFIFQCFFYLSNVLNLPQNKKQKAALNRGEDFSRVITVVLLLRVVAIHI